MFSPRPMRCSLTKVSTALLAVSVLLAFAAVASGDIPKKINYQGRLINPGGEPLSGSHTVVFRIFDADVAGAELWAETRPVLADTSGVFSVMLGSVDSIDAGFDGQRWLEVEVDGEILTPRREMVSVPFAFQAANAHMVAGLHADAFADSAHGHNSLEALDGEPQSALFVDDEGSVGVGTQTPDAKMDVAGKAKMTGFEMPTGAAAGQVLTSDASGIGTWQTPQAAPDGDWVIAGSNMYSAVPGGVGIGTINPGGPLHVRRDQNAQTAITIENQDPGSASGERLSFTDENGSVAGIAMRDNDDGGFPNGMAIFNNRAGGGIGFQTGGGTDVARIVGGKVGIRALTPQAYLHVRGEAAPPASFGAGTPMIIEDAYGPILNFHSNNTATQSINFGDPDDVDAGSIRYDHADNSLRFHTAGAERIVVAGDGRVGIGVAGETGTKLHVEQNSSTSSAAAIYGSASSSTAEGACGVIGNTASAATASVPAGVFGSATATTGYGRGVFGKTYAASGTALYGYANHGSGQNFGVQAHTNSPNGYAGYFAGGRNYFGGNVGIGTVAPLRKLHIYEDANGALSYPIKVENFGSANGTATGILFKVDGGTEDRGKGGIVYERTDTWNRGDFHILQRNVINDWGPATLAEAVVTIKNDGKVGLGTKTPAARLEVGGGDLYAIHTDGRVGIGTETPVASLDIDSPGLYAFHTDDRVGIGTAAPWARMTVVDSVGTTGAIVALNKMVADGVGGQFVGNNQARWTDLNGCGLAATGNKWGLLAVSAKTTLEAGAVHGVLVTGESVTAQARLCYRSAEGTLYKVNGDGASATVMSTSSGKRTLICPESPEAWFEDYGSGEIKSGTCHVELDPLFLDCITVSEEHPLRVFVQLTSPLDQQYYVKKGQTGFDVIVSGAGAASATFDYKVVGKWRGYEKIRFERAPESVEVMQVSSTDGE